MEGKAIGKDEQRFGEDCFEDGRDLSWFVDLEEGTKAKKRITGQ